MMMIMVFNETASVLHLHESALQSLTHLNCKFFKATADLQVVCGEWIKTVLVFVQDSAGEPLYKLFRAIKHQIEKGPVDAQVKKAKYTLNDTGLLGDDVEYIVLVCVTFKLLKMVKMENWFCPFLIEKYFLGCSQKALFYEFALCPQTLQVLVQGEGPDITPVKVLNCDTISQVKEKIIEQVYKNLPYSQRPKVDSVTLGEGVSVCLIISDFTYRYSMTLSLSLCVLLSSTEWRPGSTGQTLSDLDVTSQKEGRWRRINTLAHYNVSAL